MSTSASGSNSTLESLLKMLPVHTLEYTNFKIYDEGVWSSSETDDDGLYEIIDVLALSDICHNSLEF